MASVFIRSIARAGNRHRERGWRNLRRGETLYPSLTDPGGKDNIRKGVAEGKSS